ncbi:hypothetical protein E0Z10_g2911 [Xylaria hypoxylon]|uniref:Uncharacterized protein n=1 Tax=Xylaria hypoxylon TaxID=37992 RepID=A0A4Z0ZB31_9PEZI|nr:hypothetical protein E0Z10_g2911 [Xylaria hypoxylon]
MAHINGAATAGVIAVSVAVAAAIAIYESPELRRMTDDLRRRIAIALHTFGDSITPQQRENLFNRPEDAEGFLTSRGLGPGSVPSVPGVEADAESLRRQREELMYWNALRESKKEKDSEDEKRYRPRASTGGSSFDDFLKQDEQAEKGAYIFQTSHEPVNNNDGLIRRRGTNSQRGLNYSTYTNPFADEHGIEDDIAFENSLMDPVHDEMSDIYSATDRGAYQPSRTLSPRPEVAAPLPPLVEVDPRPETPTSHQSQLQPQSQPQLEESEQLGPDEYMTAGQDDRNENDAYSSIQAWAQNASRDISFYSPLPVSPATASEAELISDGELTPTDSASLAGSGVDVADEVHSTRSFDVISDDGMHTPTSWTDVESMAGESEGGAVHA